MRKFVVQVRILSSANNKKDTYYEVINKKWAEDMLNKMNASVSIDEVLSYNKAAQWLIAQLCKMDIPFKVYNAGVGVKRITTDTDVCTCCKRKL